MPDNDVNRKKTPEELELEQQLALAKLKNSIGQEQRGQFTAPAVAALQGNITSEGTFIESRILARRTLMEAFHALGRNMVERLRARLGRGQDGKEKPVDLILYNAADIPCIELYAGLRRQLAALDAHYKRVNAYAETLVQSPVSTAAAAPQVGRGAEDDKRARGPVAVVPNALAAAGALVAPGPMVAGYAVGAALRTAADLASLFRVDTDFKNFDLPIDDTVLAAEFRKVIPAEWKIWHPAQFPIDPVCDYRADDSDFLHMLEGVEEKNAQALSLVASVGDKVRMLSASQATEPDAGERQLLQTRMALLSGALDSLAAVNTAFMQMQGFLTCVDSGSRTTTMNLLLRAERLIALLKNEGAFVVKLAAVSRGSNKISKWIWSSATIRHSAGTELNCLIFAHTGEMIFSDTQLRYTPYRLPDEIGNPL